MFSDSDELRFPASIGAAPRKNRTFNEARIAGVTPINDTGGTFSGEHRVAAVVGSREVEVRYVESSGEFLLLDDDDVRELSRTDLKDLASALRRYQQTVPWEDGEAGRVLVGLNEAIFPTRLEAFGVRSVSDLGRCVLVAGQTGAEGVDVVLDAHTGELSLILSHEGKGSKKRQPTTQEAHDLVGALRPLVEGRPATRKTMLLAVVIEAARRRASH
jgi:hypothetical protein